MRTGPVTVTRRGRLMILIRPGDPEYRGCAAPIPGAR